MEVDVGQGALDHNLGGVAVVYRLERAGGEAGCKVRTEFLFRHLQGLEHQSFAILAGVRLQQAHRASQSLKDKESRPGNQEGGNHVEPNLGVALW